MPKLGRGASRRKCLQWGAAHQAGATTSKMYVGVQDTYPCSWASACTKQPDKCL